MKTNAHDSVFFNAQHKFNENGSLSLTREEWISMWGRADERLGEYPGMTLLDILDDKGIRIHLENLESKLLSKGYSDGWHEFQLEYSEDFFRSIKYLYEEDRLPASFQHYVYEMGLS